MSKKDLYFYIWAFPFIGAVLGFIINMLLQAGNSNAGISIMLGFIGGFLALICLILGEKFSEPEEDSENLKNRSDDGDSEH